MKDMIVELCEHIIEKANSTKNIIVQLENEPELILTSLFNPQAYQPYYDVPFYEIGREHVERYHQFQKYVMDILIPWIQIKFPQFDFASSQPERYHSGINVTYNKDVIFSFDFYHHTYHSISHESSSNILKLKEKFEEDYKRCQQLFEEINQDIENPNRILKTFKDRLYFFIYRKKILKMLEEESKKYQDYMMINFKGIQELEKSIKTANDKEYFYLEQIMPLIYYFENLGYTRKQ